MNVIAAEGFSACSGTDTVHLRNVVVRKHPGRGRAAIVLCTHAVVAILVLVSWAAGGGGRGTG